MLYYLIKLFLSAGIIVAVTEVSKFNATLGGLIKSLPLISLLAILWLYADTKDVDKIATLSISTLWFVLPTLPFFIVLPLLLKQGVEFYISLLISTAVMLVGYVLMVAILKNFGFKL
jgi:hypothetical protein